jgi:rod shape-determining protein MreC
MARVVDVRRNRLMLAALVVVHLVVISQQVQGGNGGSLLQRVVFGVISPLQNTVARAVRTLGHAWTGYVDLRGVHDDNERLSQEVRSLESQLQQKEHEAEESERLRELLELRPILPLDTLVAEVVARDGQPFFRTLTVNKGSRDGVSLNAAVLSSAGVVGRVIALGPHAARVQLLLDRGSGVGVLLERTRTNAVASGQVAFGESAATDLLLKYVPAFAELAVGDLVVTSGLDRVYPKGLVVGRVSSVGTASGLFRDSVLVAPSARFDVLEEVLIAKTSAERETFTEAVK